MKNNADQPNICGVSFYKFELEFQIDVLAGFKSIETSVGA